MATAPRTATTRLSKAKKAETAADPALEIARLRRRLDLLQQISRTISETLDLDEVLARIMQTVGEVTSAEAVLLYLLSADGKELILRASSRPHPDLVGEVRLKVGEGVTGWAAAHKEAVVIPRHAREDKRFKFFPELPEDRCEAFLAVPILRRGDLVGVVNAHHNRPHEYDRETVDLVQAIAQQVGGAIDNALLFAETRRRAQQIEMLSKVSGAVVSNNYLDEILQLIVSMTANQMHSKVCSLMLIDEERGELMIAATQSLSPGYKNKPPIKVGQSVSGLAVTERKPIVITDVQHDERYAYPDVAKADGLRSLLCVPMLVKEKVLGVLNLYTTEPREFTADDIQILQTIAHQAAVAIQNTRLLTETLQMREQLETRKLVERAKGLLQRELGLTEEQAFRMIQKKSMDSCKPMKEIADAIVLAAELRGEPKPTGRR